MRSLVTRSAADQLGARLTVLLLLLLSSFARPVYAAAEHTSVETAATTNAAAPRSLATASASTTQPSASPSAPTATATPTPAAKSTPAVVIDRSAVLSYVGDVVKWHQLLAGVARSVTDPSEAIFAADDRRLANETLTLAFDFAHAAATFLREPAPSSSSPTASASASPTPTSKSVSTADGLSDVAHLSARRAQIQSTIDDLKKQLKTLADQAATAAPLNKPALHQKIIADQAQLDLEQSRVDSITAMINFQQSTATAMASSSGFEAELDELQRSASLPPAKTVPSAAGPISPNEPALIASAQQFMTLTDKQRLLSNADESSHELLDTTAALQAVLIKDLNQIDAQGLARALPAGNTTLTEINQTREDFQQLTHRGKLLADAALPLAKEIITLKLYVDNLDRWRERASQRSASAFRELAVRGSVLAALLLLVFIASAIWRRLVLSYVQDLQRRYQLLQIRRFVVGVAVLLILILTFASGLGSFATFMGFAAAGIAVALQNVILSVAGYFYLSGRFGIRVGDRVQIAGINGDVLEIGFFKMTLMELVGDERGGQPSGRAVIFPNSVVFQPSSNFFRQLPGTDYVWNEMRFSLAPDCDYRLAEKRLTDVVNDVYAHYRDIVQREFRETENKFNLRLESPRPRTRLQLSQAGLEVVIRYPVSLRSSPQVADDIARRLVDAIRNEPALRLATIGTPAIQPGAPPAASGASTSQPTTKLATPGKTPTTVR